MTSKATLLKEVIDAFTLKIKVYNITCQHHPVYVRKDVFNGFYKIELSERYKNQEILYELRTFPYIGYSAIIVVLNYKCLCRSEETIGEETLRKVLDAFKVNEINVIYITKIIYLQYQDTPNETNFGKKLYKEYFKRYFQYFQRSEKFRKFDFIKPKIEEYIENNLYLEKTNSDNSFIELADRDYQLYLDILGIDNLILMQYITNGRYKVIDELLATFGRLMENNCMSVREFLNLIIRNDGFTIKENLGIVQAFTNADLYFYNINAALAIIINNKHFTSNSLKIREGSEKDVEKLCRAFQISKVAHCVLHNLTRDQIMAVIEALRELNFNLFKNIFLCIMSHGEENGIIQANDGPLKVADITKLYKAITTNYEDVYTFLILAACRGGMEPEWADEDDIKDTPPLDMPRNMTVYFSTREGLISYRDAIEGKPFITFLTESYLTALHNEKFQNVCDSIYNSMNEDFGPEFVGQNEDITLCKQPTRNKEIIGNIAKYAMKLSEKLQCKVITKFPIGISVESKTDKKSLEDDPSANQIKTEKLQLKDLANISSNKFQCLEFLNKFAPFESWKYLLDFENNLKSNPNSGKDLEKFFQFNQLDIILYIENALSLLIADYLALQCQWGEDREIQNLYRVDKLNFINILWEVVKNIFLIDSKEEFNIICKTWLEDSKMRISKSAVLKKLQYAPFENEYDLEEVEQILQQNDKNFNFIKNYILNILLSFNSNEQLKHFSLSDHLYYKKLTKIRQCSYKLFREIKEVLPQLDRQQVSFFRDFKFYNINEFLIFNHSLHVNKSSQTWLEQYLELGIVSSTEPKIFLQRIWLRLFSENILSKLSWLPDEKGLKTSLKFLKITNIIQNIFCKNFEYSNNLELFDKICNKYFVINSELKVHNRLIKELPLETLQDVLEYNEILKNSSSAVERLQNFLTINWHEQKTIDNNLNKVLTKILNKQQIFKNLKNSIAKDELIKTFQKLFLTQIIYKYVKDLNETDFNDKLKNWFDLGDFKNEKLSNCAMEYFIENIPFVDFVKVNKCDQLFENFANSKRLKLFLKELVKQRKQSENCVIEMCQEIFDTSILNNKHFEYLNSNIIKILKLACQEWLVSDDNKEWNHLQQYSEDIDYWFDNERLQISSILDNTPLEDEEQLFEFNALLKKSNNCHKFIETFLRKFLNFQSVYSALTFLLNENLDDQSFLETLLNELYQIIFKIYGPAKNKEILNEEVTVLYNFLWSTPYIYYRDETLLLKERRIQVCIENFMELTENLGLEYDPLKKSFKSKYFDIFTENYQIISKDFTMLAEQFASHEEDFENLRSELMSYQKTQNPLANALDNAEYHFDKNRLALEEILINHIPMDKAYLIKLEGYLNSSEPAQIYFKDFLENHKENNLNSVLKLLEPVKVNIFMKWLKLLKEELIQDLNWQLDVQNLLLTQILKQIYIPLTGDFASNEVELFLKNFFNNCNYRKAFYFLKSLPFKTLEQVKVVENDIKNNLEFKKYLQEFLEQIPCDKINSIDILREIFNPIIEECIWFSEDKETQKYCLNTSSFINVWITTFQGQGQAPAFYKYMNSIREKIFPREVESIKNKGEFEKIIKQLRLNENLIYQLKTCILGSEGTLSYWRNFSTKKIKFSSDLLKYYDETDIKIYNMLYQLLNDSFLENCDCENEIRLPNLDNSMWTETKFDKLVIQSLFEETHENIALLAKTVPFKSLQDLRVFENRIKESQIYCNKIQNAIKNSKYFKIEAASSLNTIYDMFRDIFASILDKCIWNCLDLNETKLCCISQLKFTDILHQTINSERKPSNWKFLAELQENLFKPFPSSTTYKEILTIPKWKFHYELRRYLFEHTPRELDEFDEEFMDLENIIKKLPLDNLTVLESYLQRSSNSMECWLEMLKNKFNYLHHENDNNDYKMQIFKLWTMVVSEDLFRQYDCYKEFKKSLLWLTLYRTLSGDQELFDLYSEYCFLFSHKLNFAKYKFIKYLPISNIEELNYFEQNLTLTWYRNIVKDYIYNIFQYFKNIKNEKKVEIEYILYKQFELILQQFNDFDNNLLQIKNWDLKKLKFTNLLQEVYVELYKVPDWEFVFKLKKMILSHKPQAVTWCQLKSLELQEIIKHLPLSNKRLIYQLEECLNSSENALNYWLYYISKNVSENVPNFWQYYIPTEMFDYNAAEKDVYAFWHILLHDIVKEQCNWDNEMISLTITKTFRFIYGNSVKFNKYSKRWFCENIWGNVFKFFNFKPEKPCENLIEFDKLISKYQSSEVKKCFQEIFRQETQNEPNELLNKIAHLIKNISNKFKWCREDLTSFKEYCSEFLKDYSETSNVTEIFGEYQYTKHFIYYIFEKSDEISKSNKNSESDEKSESDENYSEHDFVSLTLFKLLQQTFAELYKIPKCEFLYLIRRKILPETPQDIDKYELDKATIEHFSRILPLTSLNKFDEFSLYLQESEYNNAYFYTFLKWICKSDETLTNDEYKKFIYRVWHSFLAKDLIRHAVWTNDIENAEICQILFKVVGLEDRKFYTYFRILVEFYPEKDISWPITSMKQLIEMDKLLNDSTSYKTKIEKYFLEIFKLNAPQQNYMLEMVSELFKPILSECIWHDSKDPLNCTKYKLNKSSLLILIQEKFEQIYNLSEMDFMYSLHTILFKETIIKVDQFPLKTKEELWQLENIVNNSEHASRYLLEFFPQLIINMNSDNYIKFPFWVYLLDEAIIAQLNWDNDIKPLTVTKILNAVKVSRFIGSHQLFSDPLYRKVVCSLKNLPFKSLEHLKSFDKEISENSEFRKCMEKYLAYAVDWWLKMSKLFPLSFAVIKDDCVWDYQDRLEIDNMKPCIRLLTLTDMLQQLYYENLSYPKWKFLYIFRLEIFDRSPICTKDVKHHLQKFTDLFPFYTKFELQQFVSLIETSEEASDLWFRYILALKPFDVQIEYEYDLPSVEVDNDAKTDFTIYVFHIWHHLFHESFAEKCKWDDIKDLAITYTLSYPYKRNLHYFFQISEFWFNDNDFRKGIDYSKTVLPSNLVLPV